MSFSTETKEELARILPEKHCCRLAELSALIRMDGTITISAHHKMGLNIVTENAAVARKAFRLAKQVFQMDTELQVQRSTRLKKNNHYIVKFTTTQSMPRIFEELGIMDKNGSIQPGIKKELVKTQCCRRSYLRGVFLGAGSVNNPEGNYHLEIITNDIQYAESLAALINRFKGLQAKISSRKKWHMVYLKESDQIVHFLNIIGAHQALLSFENTRIVKEMRNQVNRLVNCETANLNKTVNASMRQVESIKLLEEIMGLEKLPVRLKDLARLRLENPDISLKELGEMMDPPVGKSGVNHRMRKIEELADDIRIRKEQMNLKKR